MPRALKKGGPALEIRLVDPPRIYQPGTVLLGEVVRKSHLVTAHGHVSVKLVGRSKSKIRQQEGRFIYVYRGRYNFFHDQQLHLKDLRGPMHVSPGGEPATWPFAITIPEHPDVREVAAGNAAEHTYLSLEPQDIASTPLPDSFAFEGEGLGSNSKASSSTTSRRRYFTGREHGGIASEVPKSLLPCRRWTTSSICPERARCVVKTVRMVPGMEETELTFKQKTKKFFGTSSVPRFSLTYRHPSR